jgi:flagellar basal-body rod modification protein FlgD
MPLAVNDTPQTILTLEEMQPKDAAAGAMGKDQFLKLFVAQLSHQDPMNPMNDSEFMGQMASFSTLEQVSNLAAANERVAANLTSSNAIGLIGRTVSYVDENDEIQTGTVEKVTTAGGKPTLTVNGVDGIDPATITQVA